MATPTFARTVGPHGRRNQQLLQDPRDVLHVVRARSSSRQSADDRATNDGVGDAYRGKYESEWPEETSEMLRDQADDSEWLEWERVESPTWPRARELHSPR